MSEDPATYGAQAHIMATTFGGLLKKKFLKGAEEHGGDLHNKPCLKFMQDEILDIATYHYALQQQLDDCVFRLQRAIAYCHEEHTCKEMEAIKNILTYGNASGEKYDE